ncbi:LysE family translocator [Thalassotalea sp. 1_MG-2023]|uniref:LysE family translocator n=1 Tax=Thalassotalea sp. 1_MG-2023 TaxID=3062680 RepID=UPI0026E29D44|nr:LysE family translocator [Thalassotalea sp. 1_MG-2023]MDO6426889.1 LysE family translocator [Thalassotalea sp. 1_MG-2023]
MMDLSTILIFFPTFFLISLTPGMCMTLALSLGMSIGVRKTCWMMYGELLGVAIVAISSVLGVATLMLNSPLMFLILKLVGACYLIYIATQMWLNKGKLSLNQTTSPLLQTDRFGLFKQGFITAIANPKGWAFMVSLLPPFIDDSHALPKQLFVLVVIILFCEFICMCIYATGGKGLSLLLAQRENVKLLNKISAFLMFCIAIWLILS